MEQGVNIELGDDISKMLYEASRQTWSARSGKLGEIIMDQNHYRGLRYIGVSVLPIGTIMGKEDDGIGTKVYVGERMDDHSTMAFNLVAMAADDTVTHGGEPVLLGNTLDVRSLEDEDGQPYMYQMRSLASGFVEACNAAGVAAIGGELAELGDRVGGYGGFNYNWTANCTWFGNKARKITGKKIKPGDELVALHEPGPRSNGITRLRGIFREAYGPEWHLEEFQDSTIGQHALHPATIYAKAVTEMTGGWDITRKPKAEIHGIAHISGGGIPSKLGDLLSVNGLGADLLFLFEVPEILKKAQGLGDVSDREAYSRWNMGQGMIIATRMAEDVMEVAEKYGIEAKIVGEVTKKPGIRLLSEGIFNDGRALEF